MEHTVGFCGQAAFADHRVDARFDFLAQRGVTRGIEAAVADGRMLRDKGLADARHLAAERLVGMEARLRSRVCVGSGVRVLRDGWRGGRQTKQYCDGDTLEDHGVDT
ncbi:MAG TPA: hypothetical protein VFQ95_09855 [Rhodanobacteraceae bacterium]|nr:hypothetical protein [Rhodanobacteraceae bacterium]